MDVKCHQRGHQHVFWWGGVEQLVLRPGIPLRHEPCR